MSKEHFSQVSILIPVRNEGLNLAVMLKILQALFENSHEVIVICDSAEDESIPVIHEMQSVYPRLKLVINEIGNGVINAIKCGVRSANEEIILIFAADEIGPVLAIEEMLSLVNEGCDFVSCTRYAHGGRRLGGSFIGGILSRMANKLFSFAANGSLSDATTGVKMFRKNR